MPRDCPSAFDAPSFRGDQEEAAPSGAASCGRTLRNVQDAHGGQVDQSDRLEADLATGAGGPVIPAGLMELLPGHPSGRPAALSSATLNQGLCGRHLEDLLSTGHRGTFSSAAGFCRDAASRRPDFSGRHDRQVHPLLFCTALVNAPTSRRRIRLERQRKTWIPPLAPTICDGPGSTVRIRHSCPEAPGAQACPGNGRAATFDTPQ